jgi:hypothetical protein
MAWWGWLLIGAGGGCVIALLVLWALMLPMMCEAYLDVEIGELARDPATRDMTVRELRAERDKAKGG